jgi:hypothetical protein
VGQALSFKGLRSKPEPLSNLKKAQSRTVDIAQVVEHLPTDSQYHQLKKGKEKFSAQLGNEHRQRQVKTGQS